MGLEPTLKQGLKLLPLHWASAPCVDRVGFEPTHLRDISSAPSPDLATGRKLRRPGGTRTHTPVKEPHFECGASTRFLPQALAWRTTDVWLLSDVSVLGTGTLAASMQQPPLACIRCSATCAGLPQSGQTVGATCCVRKGGVEPPRPWVGHSDLNAARLPIPPHAQVPEACPSTRVRTVMGNT